MSESTLTPDELTKLLEQLRVQTAGARSSSDVAQAQVDLLLARIASVTGALRSAADNDTARLAARLLIGDLALVAAQFRARANDVSASLVQALDGIRAEIEATDPGRAR